MVDHLLDRKQRLAYSKPERHVVVGQQVLVDNAELVASAHGGDDVDRRDPQPSRAA